MTLRSGQMALFDDNDNLLSLPPVAIDYQIYGVDVQTSLNPQLVMLGDGGLTRDDTQLGYVIEPAGYAAGDVQIDLFAGSSWQNYLLGSAVQGAGSATLSQGSVLAPQQAYSTRVVLNRGTSAQIEFDKIPLPTLYADLDLDSDNNAGTNADGTHALPSRNALEDQVEDLGGFPGKVIQPNLLDVDKDKVPGFADGIDRNEQAGENASAPFVPLLLELAGSGLDPAVATVRFNYPGSDPDNVLKSTVDGKDIYTPAPGSLRIWTKDGGASRKAAEVSAGGDYVAAQKDYTLVQLGTSSDGVWRFYVEGLSVPAGSPTPRIAMTIDPDGAGSLAAIDADAVLVTPIPSALVPDYNHNREIDDEDRNRAARGDIFYFWINDDDDSGETGGDDIPKEETIWMTGRDCDDNAVDGVRDLIDFFPVVFDVGQLLVLFPPQTYEYKLKAAQHNLNVILSDLEPSTATSYLTDVSIAQRVAVEDTVVYPVSAAGDFSGSRTTPAAGQQAFQRMLQRIRDNKKPGVLLIEGHAAGTEPLVLEISDAAGNQVFATRLNLSLDGVEQMFRHKNLIYELSQHNELYLLDHPVPTDKGMPDRLVKTDFTNQKHFDGFDAESDKNNFVHIHGYNVNDQDARGEQAETFKRLYWSRSRAKFWGITWYGWESQGTWYVEATPCAGTRSPNYHVNVRHAFNTGHLLRDFVDEKVTANVTIFAHSLGNMVVSSAIRDGMISSNYLMVNPAVAEEAYTPETDYAFGATWVNSTKPSMYHPAWRYPDGEEISIEQGYQPFLWASEWYKQFSHDDSRATLTWRNFFAAVRDKTYVYYSPTDEAFRPFNYTVEDVDTQATYPTNRTDFPGLEDVMQNWSCFNNSKIGTYSWSIQELFKGRFATIADKDSDTGGWGFNLDQQDGYVFLGVHILPALANTYLPEKVKTKPFFSKNTDLLFLYKDQSPPVSASLQEELLANEFPALTFAAGHRGVKKIRENDEKRDIDMREKFAVGKPSWPRGTKQYEWRHSDVYRVAYSYLSALYDEWVVQIKGDSQ